MARKQKYHEDEVAYFLSKRKGTKVSKEDKFIEIGKKNDLGNGCWGRIDFLVNYCNWTALQLTH
jgi:hypothetical protein